MRELKPGLWRWTARHAEWDGRIVSSAYVEAPAALCPDEWLSESREHQVACLRRLLEVHADLVVPAHGEPFTVAELAALLHSPPSAA